MIFKLRVGFRDAMTIFNQFIDKSCDIMRRNWGEIFQRFEFSYT